MLEVLQRLWRRLVRGRTTAERSESATARPAAKQSGPSLGEGAREPVAEQPIEDTGAKLERGAATAARPRSGGPEDDLTVIRGIGPATQRRLQVAGIQSYEDLARATPEEIHRALVDSRRGANVQQWINRARQLSRKRESASP
ncbi:MAG: DUF4332 domain-containing protein [Alphaproteobacteria bacterium]